MPEQDSERPAEEVVAAFLDRLRDTGTVDEAVAVGDAVPSFMLPTADGRLVDCDDLLARGPLVVSFIRGGWCTVCRGALDALHDAYPEIRRRGAALVAITPETGQPTGRLARELALPFDLLCDLDLGVAMAFGLVFRLDEGMRRLFVAWDRDLPLRQGNEGWLLPVPATYVIDAAGTVRAAHIDIDYMNRMPPAEILAALDAIAASR